MAVELLVGAMGAIGAMGCEASKRSEPPADSAPLAPTGSQIEPTGTPSLAPTSGQLAPSGAVRFDSARAWKDLEAQVALGPRPAGSAAIQKTRGKSWRS